MVLIGTLTQVIWGRLRQFSTKPLFYSDISPLVFICGIFIVSNLIFNCCAGQPTPTKISGEYIAIKLWSGVYLVVCAHADRNHIKINRGYTVKKR